MNENLDQKKIIAIWLTGFLALFSLAGLVSAWLRGSLNAAALTNLVTIAATLVVFVLIRKRLFSIAFYLSLAAAFFQIGIMHNLSRAGTSFALSTMLMVIGIAYAILLLPTRAAARAIIYSAILGFITACIDYWGPDSRPWADNQINQILLAFTVVLIIAIVILILRLWKHFDFATKMVVSFIAAALLTVSGSQIFNVFNQETLANNLGRLSQDKAALEQIVNANTQGIMLVSILGVTLSSILGLFLASVITRQLRRMVMEVDQVVSTGNVSQNIEVDSEDEIGQLAVSLQSLMSYIKDRAATAVRLSQGDLTEQVKILSPQDVLGIAFEKMLSNLNQTISLVIENARMLDSASSQLADAADMSEKATTQIAQTIQHIARGITTEAEAVSRTSSSVEQMSKAIDGIARGASNQSLAVNETSTAINHINQMFEEVVKGVNDVEINSRNTQESANQGYTVVQTNLEGMQAIKQKVDLSTQKVEEMGRQTENIGMILDTIDDIASQTNMLALNAAIEAARAGELGKGFAVVADEVRKLAERSSTATKEIGSLIKNIQFTVGEAVTAMRASTLEVENGVSYSNSASAALNTILESVKKVNERTAQLTLAAGEMRSAAGHLIRSVETVSAVVEENTAATEEMSSGSSEVVEAIKNISSVSEENSAAVEQVSASTEEISAQVKEVSDLARSAASVSQALTRAVAAFRVK